MSTSYAERFDLVESAQFRKRIQYAVWVAARAVIKDVNSTADQKMLARSFLRGVLDADIMRRVAIACVADPVVGNAGAAATDEDIQAAVGKTMSELLP